MRNTRTATSICIIGCLVATPIAILAALAFAIGDERFTMLVVSSFAVVMVATVGGTIALLVADKLKRLNVPPSLEGRVADGEPPITTTEDCLDQPVGAFMADLGAHVPEFRTSWLA